MLYVDTKMKGSSDSPYKAEELKDMMFFVEYTKATAKHLNTRQAK